jgi:hypothetical protein
MISIVQYSLNIFGSFKCLNFYSQNLRVENKAFYFLFKGFSVLLNFGATTSSKTHVGSFPSLHFFEHITFMDLIENWFYYQSVWYVEITK